MSLANPTETIKVLEKFNLRLTKFFGQNFLVDANIVGKIVSAAELLKSDNVLEAGAGIGTLSKEIAPLVGTLSLIELDKRLIPALKYTVGGINNVKIIQQDALRLDYSSLLSRPNKMVSNLPYNIASPLILKLLEEAPWISDYTLMVQKEVADRFLASCGSKDYGGLTLKINYFSDVKRLFNVSKNVFMPKPKIDSTVISIKKIKNRNKNKVLFEVIDNAFSHRRKTLRNSLLYSGVNEEEIDKALNSCKIDSSKRAEQIELSGYLCLTQALKR